MRKKLLKSVSVICAVLCAFSVILINAGAVYSEGMLYTEKNGALVLTATDSTVNGALVIPAEVEGKAVVEIDKNVFANNTKITSVTIPASVKKIGNKAFYGCPMIETVTFENSDETVTLGDEVFSGCTSLKNLILPVKLKAVPQKAFAGCALPSVSLPDGTASIGAEAFINNQSLTAATIPASVTSVGKHVFFGCAKLSKINVSEDNNDYTDVDGNLLSKDKTEFLQYALGKTATEFTVPAGVTEIGSGAFAFSSLKKVILPDGLETIGWGAFQDSTDLSSINFPESLTGIGESAFYHCYSLKEVTIPGSVKEFTSAFSYSGVEKVTIMSGVGTIPNDAFTGCASLKEVIIPDTVTKIESAFLDCTSLEEINIPASVTDIAHDAFSGDTKLTIVAPEGSAAEKYAKDNGINYKKSGSDTPGGNDEISKIIIDAPEGKKNVKWKFKAHITAKADLPEGYKLVWYEGRNIASKDADFTTGQLTEYKEYTVKIVDEDGNIVSSGTQEKTVKITVQSDIFTKIISFFMRLFGNDTVTL